MKLSWFSRGLLILNSTSTPTSYTHTCHILQKNKTIIYRENANLLLHNTEGAEGGGCATSHSALGLNLESYNFTLMLLLKLFIRGLG